MKAAVAILSVVLILALLAAGYLGLQMVEAKNTVSVRDTTIESLNKDKTSLQTQSALDQANIAELKNKYDVTSAELAQIKLKYPPHYFASEMELGLWLSQAVKKLSADKTSFQKALQLQLLALGDGFIISVGIIPADKTFLCTARLASGVDYYAYLDGKIQKVT